MWFQLTLHTVNSMNPQTTPSKIFPTAAVFNGNVWSSSKCIIQHNHYTQQQNLIIYWFSDKKIKYQHQYFHCLHLLRGAFKLSGIYWVHLLWTNLEGHFKTNFNLKLQLNYQETSSKLRWRIYYQLLDFVVNILGNMRNAVLIQKLDQVSIPCLYSKMYLPNIVLKKHNHILQRWDFIWGSLI